MIDTRVTVLETIPLLLISLLRPRQTSSLFTTTTYLSSYLPATLLMTMVTFTFIYKSLTVSIYKSQKNNTFILLLPFELDSIVVSSWPTVKYKMDKDKWIEELVDKFTLSKHAVVIVAVPMMMAIRNHDLPVPSLISVVTVKCSERILENRLTEQCWPPPPPHLHYIYCMITLWWSNRHIFRLQCNIGNKWQEKYYYLWAIW